MNYFDRDLVRFERDDTVQPFLKWAGGKRWLFRRYRNLFPQNVEVLIDPFIGGGSSFFCLAPQKAILSDLNEDLIDLYKSVRNHPRKLTRSMVYFHHEHSKQFFYRTRRRKPRSLLKKSAWLLYLNRTCWNGLFRVNLEGTFNVPMGTKKSVFTSLDELDRAAAALKRATILSADFEQIIDCAKKGDLVFADPPYFENCKDVRFLKYNANVFSWKDQLRLRDALVRASRRGAKCFVTNANHTSLLDIYKQYGVIHKLIRQSVVSGSNKGRGIDREILEASKEDFELSLSIFVGADVATEASIFSIVNLAQTKVNKSLAYDLFAYATKRSPEKTCHEIVVALDKLDDSPFKGTIKRLGTKTENRFGETLSQATLVKGILPYISKNPLSDRDAGKRYGFWEPALASDSTKRIFFEFFRKDEDAKILKIIVNYFNAIKHRWPTAWEDSGTGNIIKRTNGFNGFIRFLRPAYLNFTKKREVVTQEQFATLFKDVKLTDADFNPKRFIPGTSGSTEIYRELVKQTGIQT